MDVMGWSSVSMTQRYQHVPDALRQRIADQMGGLLWGAEDTQNRDDDDGAAGALVPA
jgi:hypothetical protein